MIPERIKIIGYTEELEKTEEQITVRMTSDQVIWWRKESQGTGRPKPDAPNFTIGTLNDLVDDEYEDFAAVSTRWLVERCNVYATSQEEDASM